MLITKELDITINTKLDRTYYKLGYYDKDNCNETEMIKIRIVDLLPSSRIKVKVKCDICGNEKEIGYYKYLKNIKKFNIYTCSQKCAIFKSESTKEERYGDKNYNNRDKAEQTCLDTYGFKNVQQVKEIKERTNQTNEDRYGDKILMKNKDIRDKFIKTMEDRYDKEHAFQVVTFKEKAKQTNKDRNGDENYNNRDQAEQTCLINLGVKNPQQNKEVREKTINTCLENFKVKYPYQNKEIKKLIDEVNLERYDTIYPSQNSLIKEKIIKTNLETYNKKIKEHYPELEILNIDEDRFITAKCDKGHTFTTHKDLLRCRKYQNIILCTECNPIGGDSDAQIELYEFIKENYSDEIILNDRKILNRKELDIYLPELKLAFEYNGLWCHNELYRHNNYHRLKTDLCEEKGIQLIHIWEDDWLYKQDIIKSMILNKLNKNLNKIYARKCEIKEIIDNKIISEFLINNHIQGLVGSKIKLGLYYDNELVSLMTFGNKRKNMNSTSESNIYEMLRFCNKLNTTVIGGASKIFQFFIKNYNPKEVITYANRFYSNGELYKQLGFDFIHKTEPNYYYIVKGLRKYRFNFRHDVLVKEGYDKNKTEHEIMLERKIYRIYDSGNLKFSYKNK